jgi:hypothetical protein
VAYDTINHKEFAVANWSKSSLLVGLVTWSFLLIGVSYAIGVSSEKNHVASSNKPLTASKVASTSEGVELAKASEYGKSKQFDQVISLLTPEVADKTNDTDQRAAGKVLIAQAYFAKADLENALKWYEDANTTSSSARLDADMGTANVASQLYGKTLPTDPSKAATYKATAIQALTQAQGLTTNVALKSQVSAQLTALSKTN